MDKEYVEPPARSGRLALKHRQVCTSMGSFSLMLRVGVGWKPKRNRSDRAHLRRVGGDSKERCLVA